MHPCCLLLQGVSQQHAQREVICWSQLLETAGCDCPSAVGSFSGCHRLSQHDALNEYSNDVSLAKIARENVSFLVDACDGMGRFACVMEDFT